MNMLRGVFGVIPIAAACVCVATTTIQASALTVFWCSGAVTKDKLVRFAAVVYGLDLSEVPSTAEDQTLEGEVAEDRSRDSVLASRVSVSPLLTNRQSAVERGTDDTHILFQQLQTDTERFDNLRTGFDKYLAQLESDIRDQAIQEMRATLEILQPKQAKDLILRMLGDEGLDPEDDVVQDVVSIIKAMPQDRLKKVLGEFKTDREREQLHRILVEIGDLEDR